MRQKLLATLLVLLSAIAVKAQESKATMRVYDYQYQFLPILAGHTETGDVGMYMLGTPMIADKILKESDIVSPFKSDDITVDTIRHNDETIIVWTFPEPKEVPIALYIAFVPDNGHYSVYTLEKTFNFDDNELWIIGGITSGSHTSYTDIPRPASPEDFVAKLLETIKKDAPAVRTVYPKKEDAGKD